LLINGLVQTTIAQETDKERKAREKQEQKDREKAERDKAKAEKKMVRQDRKLFKLKGDAYMMAGDEINALRYYDSAIVHIDEEEAKEIAEVAKANANLKKGKEPRKRKYPDDYLDIVQKQGIIHLSKDSYILADSLLSARVEVLKRQDGADGSDYADALADLAELYIEQGNVKKADSILTSAQAIAKKRANTQKTGEFIWNVLKTGFVIFAQNNFAGLGLSDTDRQQLIDLTNALFTAQKVVNAVKGMADPFLSKFNNSLAFRNDNIGRYVPCSR
jgi:hypothetical protein